MKKIIVILMLSFSVFAAQAQFDYSGEHLKMLSQEELDDYMNMALKLQRTGRVVNIVGVSILGGTVLTIAGVALTASGDWALGAVVIAFFGGLAGVGTLAVGIPLNLTGKSRVNRINALNNTAFNKANIGIHPCTQYNFMTQSYQPGIAVKISF